MGRSRPPHFLFVRQVLPIRRIIQRELQLKDTEVLSYRGANSGPYMAARFRLVSTLGFVALLLVSACGRHHPISADNPRACAALSETMNVQENAFLDRAQAIREQHLLLREYDRQMIEALTQRRTELQATSLTDVPQIDEVAGCSGQPLEDIRRHVKEEVGNIQANLHTLRRALRSDPVGVFIDP